MEVQSISPGKARVERADSVRPAANRRSGRAASHDTSSTPERTAPVSRAELDKAVEGANEVGKLLARSLNFSIDDATNKVVVQVIDEESGEVVRQVPPLEMLRISAHLSQLKEMNNRVMGAVKSVILDVKY